MGHSSRFPRRHGDGNDIARDVSEDREKDEQWRGEREYTAAGQCSYPPGRGHHRWWMRLPCFMYLYTYIHASLKGRRGKEERRNKRRNDAAAAAAAAPIKTLEVPESSRQKLVGPTACTCKRRNRARSAFQRLTEQKPIGSPRASASPSPPPAPSPGSFFFAL